MAAVPSIGRASRVQHAAAPEADLTRALYEKYANQIFRYCLHQLGSREEAEDAVQSTFLNAFRGIKGGVVPELESAWLFKIANNVCLSRRRSSWRRGRIESPADFDVVEELTPAPSRHADELIGLQDVLEQMPENQRRAILLREWQGLSYHEIAEELELSQAAVETLIFRARRSLAQGLEKPAEKKRRLVRGADWANVLAGMKSLLLGSSVAVKVAATVAVVSATTVVASAPVQHQARSHHPVPATPAAVSSTQSSKGNAASGSAPAEVQRGLAPSPVRPLVAGPVTGGAKPTIDASSDLPPSVVVVPPPTPAPEAQPPEQQQQPVSAPSPSSSSSDKPASAATPPAQATVTPAQPPKKQESGSDSSSNVKKQDFPSSVTTPPVPVTVTPAAPPKKPDSSSSSDSSGNATKQDPSSSVTTTPVSVVITPAQPPKKQDSGNDSPGQAKKQDAPSSVSPPAATPATPVTTPVQSSRESPPVVAPVTPPPPVQATTTPASTSSTPPGQTKKQDGNGSALPQANPALNSPIAGSTGSVPVSVQDASNAQTTTNGKGNSGDNGNGKGKGK